MFSFAASNILRVGALVLAGGAIAGGFYLYSETRGDDDRRVQAPAATASPGVTSSPAATSSPSADATPTTPDPIDTSDWETYNSPLGVAIEYPPDWNLRGPFDATGEPTASGDYVVIANPVADESGELGDTPGVMRVSLRPYPGAFDPVLFSEICELPAGVQPRDPFDGPPDTSVQLTVESQDAVLCIAEDLTPARLPSFGFLLWIEMPSGEVVEVASGVVAPSGDDVAVARAIVDSVFVTARE